MEDFIDAVIDLLVGSDFERFAFERWPPELKAKFRARLAEIARTHFPPRGLAE